MRVALVNPNWTFDGSIYFGCRAPHLPLEFGYARRLLEARGHAVRLVDAQMLDMPRAALRDAVAAFAPDMIVVTTAPSYLFWRCAPPELRVPLAVAGDLRDLAPLLVAIGPHGSTTPRAVLRKLAVDVVVMGEAEEVLLRLAETARADWPGVPSLCYRAGRDIRVQGGPHTGDVAALPALTWEREMIAGHAHHHHRFEAPPRGPGAEIETSRGCPYRCTFCAKENFRDAYRRRPLATVLAELDGLIAQGVGYFYFIDEIFLPNRPLLEALAGRGMRFGVQTRIDLWKPEMLELLGRAGCVSIEAGVESLSEAGRQRLDKDCRISTEALTRRLILAKQHVPFVQGNLIEIGDSNAAEVAAWRDRLQRHGVWANQPVPLFPYPGSPDYRRLWGVPDDTAWERADAHYRARFAAFSDIQDQQPRPLDELEGAAAAAQ